MSAPTEAHVHISRKVAHLQSSSLSFLLPPTEAAGAVRQSGAETALFFYSGHFFIWMSHTPSSPTPISLPPRTHPQIHRPLRLRDCSDTILKAHTGEELQDDIVRKHH